MSTWTTTALQELESYLRLNRLRVAASGADPDEVTADLRRHVEEEVAALHLPVVTEKEVRRIVNQIGPVPEEEVAIPAEPAPRRPGPGMMDGLASIALVLFGVILPLITIGFELFTRLCAGLVFDPLPSVWHIVLAAFVPAANYLAWQGARSPGRGMPQWLWLANGLASGVTIFYAILFFPLSFFAVIAIAYFGLGFLALCPLLSLCCTLRLRTLLKRRQLLREESVRRGWGWAAATSIAALFLLALPVPLTRNWISQAGSDSPEASRRAVERLRLWGNEGIILKECYGRRADRLWIELLMGSNPGTELARKVYFRVTGKPFNAVPPPLTKYQAEGRALLDDFDWDTGLGGNTVAGQVKGLSLVQSRFDGICQADQGWAYLEWILEFQNDHESRQREARAQILLPSGGVVSRLTLWINGEEREAAFGARSQVREAYQSVAVEQRRDPVLITATGPDRILVQCFPIQPNGGSMKVRLGVTAPLVIESTNQAALKLPCLIERNFAVPSSFQHNLWLEAPQRLSGNFPSLESDGGKSGRFALRGQIADDKLSSREATLRFPCSPKLLSVRAPDRKSNSGAVVHQRLEVAIPKLPGRIAIVLDGSEDMTSYFPEIARALDCLPAQSDLAIWLAQDGVTKIFERDDPASEPLSEKVGKLRGLGGQDDLPALLQAWEWAAAKPDSVVLWIHGPQPVLLAGAEALTQRLDWRTASGGPTILDIATRPGPNRLAEQLGQIDSLESLPRLGDLHEDLERLGAIWSGRRPDFRLVRTIVNNDASPDAKLPPTGSSHVVRLWAYDRVKSLTRSREISEAVKLAVQYQLVTAWTGAVVLESKQQFKDAGLTPVDSATVPAVPEPGTWTLLGAGLCALLIYRRRRSLMTRNNVTSENQRTL
jgi:hypothetical protein